jgi:hypothetical protein
LYFSKSERESGIKYDEEKVAGGAGGGRWEWLAKASMSCALNVSIRPPSNEENHTSGGTRGDFMAWQSNTARRKCVYDVRLSVWECGL